jgi:hypothetical protein
MRSRPISTAALLILTLPASAGSPIQLDLVTIGDPGNVAYGGGPVGINAGRGSVAYEYDIGRSEVSAGQWLAFYNTFSTQSADLAHMLRPLLWPAAPDFTYQGPGDRYEFTQALTHPEQSPLGITWRQAAMFCNWLHNGQSSDPASLTNGAYDTSTFTRNDDGTFNDQAAHNAGARFWIPTLDEWLKAAHYDPDKNGNGPGWWEYANSSDEPPTYGMPGEADVGRGLTQEQISQLGGPGAGNMNIPLGLYADVQSPWGLLDLLGGQSEFVEDWDPDAPQIWRLAKLSSNGLYVDDFTWDQAWYFGVWGPGTAGSFRIAAAVPGPPAFFVMLTVGMNTLCNRHRRRT